ncbi:hypothetical protein LguiB_009669 [Lonicera macranthoides]
MLIVFLGIIEHVISAPHDFTSKSTQRRAARGGALRISIGLTSHGVNPGTSSHANHLMGEDDDANLIENHFQDYVDEPYAMKTPMYVMIVGMVVGANETIFPDDMIQLDENPEINSKDIISWRFNGKRRTFWLREKCSLMSIQNNKVNEDAIDAMNIASRKLDAVQLDQGIKMEKNVPRSKRRVATVLFNIVTVQDIYVVNTDDDKTGTGIMDIDIDVRKRSMGPGTITTMPVKAMIDGLDNAGIVISEGQNREKK